MAGFGSTRSADRESQNNSRKNLKFIAALITAGSLCFVGSLLAASFYQKDSLVSVDKRTALSALDWNDDILRETTRHVLPSNAVKVAGEILASRDEKHVHNARHVETQTKHSASLTPQQLLAAADSMEEKENEKVVRAAAKLAARERKANEVKQAIHTLKAEAKLREQEVEMKATAAKLHAQAEKRFEEEKAHALEKATEEIEKAEAAKEDAERPLDMLQSAEDGALSLSSKVDDGSEDEAGGDDLPPLALDSDKADAGADKDLVAKDRQTQSLGANGDKFLDMNAPSQAQYDNFANMDPPGKPPKPGGGSAMYPKHHAARQEKVQRERLAAKETAEEVSSLVNALKAAKARAAQASRRLALDESAAPRKLGQLAWDYNYKADPLGDDDYAPTFYEQYEKGDLGPLAVSKWVPEDHPPSHPACRLHDIDCDELHPWGKPPADATQPGPRHSKLGDNLVGVFGQDDVVVPTTESGLVGKAVQPHDAFSKWPEDSTQNKDLLYGSARRVMGDKYLGVGDKMVPLSELEEKFTKPGTREAGQNGLADFFFGSWQQGFHKPHSKVIRPEVNMFDQPYRQHMSVARGDGHQVFKVSRLDYPTRGDDNEDFEAN